jgi:hypothetical protein
VLVHVDESTGPNQRCKADQIRRTNEKKQFEPNEARCAGFRQNRIRNGSALGWSRSVWQDSFALAGRLGVEISPNKDQLWCWSGRVFHPRCRHHFHRRLLQLTCVRFYSVSCASQLSATHHELHISNSNCLSSSCLGPSFSAATRAGTLSYASNAESASKCSRFHRLRFRAVQLGPGLLESYAAVLNKAAAAEMASWLPSIPYPPPGQHGFWEPVTSTLNWCEEVSLRRDKSSVCKLTPSRTTM